MNLNTVLLRDARAHDLRRTRSSRSPSSTRWIFRRSPSSRCGRIAHFRATIDENGTIIDSRVKKMLGGIEFTMTFIDPWTPRDKQTIGDHRGLLVHAGGVDFWFAGQGITVTFNGADSLPPLIGIDVAEVGVFDEKEKWVAGPRLNGDQTHQGRHIRLPPGQYRYR
jgi:hypothetical protein